MFPLSWLALERLCLPGGQKNLSEHLALAFGVGLAHGVLLVGFLWDSFRIQALILVYRSLFQRRCLWLCEEHLKVQQNFLRLVIALPFECQ